MIFLHSGIYYSIVYYFDDYMQKKPLKVLVFLPEIGLGGAEWQTLYMLNGLNSELIYPVLLTLNRGLNERRELPEYHYVINKSPGFDPLFALKLSSLLHFIEPDIIHLISSTAIIWGTLASLSYLNSKFIVSLWGEDWGDSILRRALLRICQRLADVVTVNSYGLRDSVSKKYLIPEGRIEVLVNGVDVERFAPRDAHKLRGEVGIGSDEVVIGWVGNIRPEKDFWTLISASEIVVSRQRNVKFLIVGGGVDYDRAVSEVEQRGLKDNFIFTGRVDDTAPYYNAMDIFVNSSISEGMCNVILEASASGLPCVVTDAPGNSELVMDGRSGFVVKRGNCVELADKILTLINNDQLKEEMGKRGREYMKRAYDMDAMVKSYQDFYLRVGGRL
ncbi:MAG: hypothetical protein DRH49_00405 [Candidatus Coatesbacteria bacterium]|nr:MAG: hypothetical protein DRH49_00405 [Candidatus Coatesbacteria bacterium]